MGDLPRDAAGWRKLVRAVGRRTRSQADAEDYAHTAFVNLSEAGKTAEIRDPSAFLFRTAFNASLNDRNRLANRLKAAIPLEDVHAPDRQPLQDEVLIARERLHRLTDGLAKLSPRTRQVFLMHRLDGMKYREIAEALGISGSAVEKHIGKAMGFLMHWMDGW
jgi:RNA polymerase sigma-70 factor (ECF subfamily)